MAEALAGKRIIVSRMEGAGLAELLTERGAVAIEIPLLSIIPALEETVRTHLEKAEAFDFIIITSPNGARAVGPVLKGRSVQRASVRLASVGPSTTRALEEFGLSVAVQPDVSHARALADELIANHAVENKSILLARGNLAGDHLPEMLTKAGARVTECVVYDTITAGAELRPELEEALAAGVDGILISSGSVAQAWVDIIGLKKAQAIMQQTPAVAIGPQAAGKMQKLGLSVASVAEKHTMEGLVEALQLILKKG